MVKIIDIISTIYTEKFNDNITQIIRLKQSGSYREYYRIIGSKNTILGVYNADLQENKAYLEFSKHFISYNLKVPKILFISEKKDIYFVEDLGDTTIFDFLQTKPTENKIIETYKKILDELIKFQFEGIKNLNLENCYPRQEFDKQSMMWDLNYFKYFVLKIAKVPFNEQSLENDFETLTTFLLSAKSDCFLYRDFQSKNIMLFENEVYFIDFQGGRKGSYFYDLASLLYDSKANLSENIKNILLNYYFEKISKLTKIDNNDFLNYFNNFLLIRLLQAFGAFGFRGIVEKKIPFIASIPNALKNIKKILHSIKLEIPELINSLNYLVNKSDIAKTFEKTDNKLKIRINSFSFLKTGYPIDEKNNGGGFVFDCRFLPNPGRQEKYKQLSGLDLPVIEYLEGIPEVENFVVSVSEIILKAAKSYENQNFTDLQVNFGCTGGQHRSVYCAEKVSSILKNLYGLNVETKHIELSK